MGPEEYIGAISMFGGNFAPKNYAECNGQILPINANSAFFAIVGDRFGGDGRVTVGTPDMRGRTPVGTGEGPGLTNRLLGPSFGSETQTLTVDQLPSHSHAANFDANDLNTKVSSTAQVTDTTVMGDITLRCNSGLGNQNAPNGNYSAFSHANAQVYANTPNDEMAPPIFSNGQLVNDSVNVVTSFSQSVVSVSVLDTGGNIPLDIVQPGRGLTFVIAVDGIFPPRT